MLRKLFNQIFLQKSKSLFSWGHGDGAEVTLKIKKIYEENCSPNGEFGLKIYNDDITPMEYVVWIMCDGMGIEFKVATNLMFEIHNRGEHIVVRGSKNGIARIADTINGYSQQVDLPLRCECEKI